LNESLEDITELEPLKDMESEITSKIEDLFKIISKKLETNALKEASHILIQIKFHKTILDQIDKKERQIKKLI
jgi:hypothetical protein